MYKKKILLTGVAGFIGYHVAKVLVNQGYNIFAIDSLNDYYDVKLKHSRLMQLGIEVDVLNQEKNIPSSLFSNLTFQCLNMDNSEKLKNLFAKEKVDIVCHLAAQPGVRTSITNPKLYIKNNVIAFFNLLECCRYNSVEHFVYASSSSVYGISNNLPFKEEQNTDFPESFYAATKKSNEIFAYNYSHMFKIPSTALRFFTVYGEWGRPDMALFKFTKSIIEGTPINLYNYGNQERDFTYITDIALAVGEIVSKGFCKKSEESWQNIYNIGGGVPINLHDFIFTLEKIIGKKAIINLVPAQDGDVKKTWANNSTLKNDYEFKYHTSIDEGLKNFVKWYKEYYL